MGARRSFTPPIFKITVFLSSLVSMFFLFMLISDLKNNKNVVLYNSKSYVKSKTVYDKMKNIIKCFDSEYKSDRYQQGGYWILKNYIRAGHGKIKCYESITMTTNGDFSFLQHIPTLVDRWRAPISMSIYAPGSDFNIALGSIHYLRKCHHLSSLIKHFVTFHIFFPLEHIPSYVPYSYDKWEYLGKNFCNRFPPYEQFDYNISYKSQNNLLYPINMARNLARDASQTYFVFSNDVELFPSLNLVEDFFTMVVKKPDVLTGENPRVFVIPPFEVKKDQELPNNKTKLLEMINNKVAQPFHHNLCHTCHAFPKQTEWLNCSETNELHIFSQTKRLRNFKFWEPFYIGTKKEPPFDERVSWEGQSNKRIQNFPMCLLNYDYLVLDNAFLVHVPGIKTKSGKNNPKREKYIKLTDKLIKTVIVPELQILYGEREGCAV